MSSTPAIPSEAQAKGIAESTDYVVGMGRAIDDRSAIAFAASGDERDRTANLLVANQALSQLSYVPRVGERGPRDKACHQNNDLMIATAVGFG